MKGAYMEEAVQRHNGFVVGKTTIDHRQYWTVRVKDGDSSYNGKKIKVLTLQEGLTLVAGLNVTFLVGTVDGPDETKVEKAFDVRIA